ncbi:MAG: hypothetical protein E7326_07735 [Clostridiales bacterium]|nr:hypothetical protein [Clostridiales bacterium]
MASTTTNLGLILPAASEAADIGVLNANFSAIDEKCDPGLFAPSGYGLGGPGKAKTDAEIDELLASWPDGATGFVRIRVTEIHDLYGQAIITKFSADHAVIRAKFLNGIHAERVKLYGTWQPWEYVNPPMQLDVEYRTTERWKGQPVYVKLVDCKGMPASGVKNVSIGTTAEHVMDFKVRLASGSHALHVIPWTDTSFAVKMRVVLLSDGNLQFNANADMSAYTATAFVKYIKA